jgi:p-cumate 2,3-dioxygenase beta subunit
MSFDLPDNDYQLQAAVAQFLYREADLLDEWRLEEWLQLFTDDATYFVPIPEEPDSDPTSSLALISDDTIRLRSRVQQLLGRAAWAENPHSRTRRLLTNIQVRPGSGSDIEATANFAVHRWRNERADMFVGYYKYLLVLDQGTFRIRHRKAVLNQDSVRPQNKISIIL